MNSTDLCSHSASGVAHAVEVMQRNPQACAFVQVKG